MKDKFSMNDIYITEENVNFRFKNEFTPQKIEPHLTNFIRYDLETHNTEGARSHNMTFYRLSKISGRNERDPTQEELQKSINDTLSFLGDNSVGNALGFFIKTQS